jgi:hypothetical protein
MSFEFIRRRSDVIRITKRHSMHLPILFPLYFWFFSLVSAFDVTLQATYRKTNGDASVFVWLDDAQNNKVVEVI